MDNDSQDKQQLPTAKRLVDLKRKGSVLRSRDFAGGLVFIATIIMLMFIAATFQQHVKGLFYESFRNINKVPTDAGFVFEFLQHAALIGMKILMPIFFMLFMISVLSVFLFGGWNFTLNAIEFKWEKLDPASNLMRIFSPKKAATEIVKSLLKASVIFGTLVFFMYVNFPAIAVLAEKGLSQAVQTGFKIIGQYLFLISCGIIVLALFDMIYQFYEYQNKAKMSIKEIKDENKDAEGSGEVKRKIRSNQFALLKQRLTLLVPKANVIITNPTHYAIALRYDPQKDHAPRVLAKGKDYMAQQIKQLAIANGIPIYEAPPLARAIFHTAKLGSEVDEGLYMAVAMVLSYVHQLKNYQMGKGKQPEYVSHLDIPDEFVYNE